MNRAGLTLLFVSLAWPLAAQGGPAQRRGMPGDLDPGITVEGTGRVAVAADTLEYRAMMVVGAEKPADAMLEYGRFATRVSKALDQLGLKGLTCELHGTMMKTFDEVKYRQWQLRQPGVMVGGEKMPAKYEVQECLTIRVPIDGLETKDIDGMIVGIMGVVTDLGLQEPQISRYGRYGSFVDYEGFGEGDGVVAPVPEGWNAGVAYTVRNPEGHYSMAVRNAIEDANAKAKLRAGFLGGKLGKVVAMETLSGDGTHVYPGKSKELPFRVVLRVRYAFEMGGSE